MRILLAGRWLRSVRKKHLWRGACFGVGFVVAAVAMALLLGCCVFSSPGYKGPVSDHFDGKRFHTPQPGPHERTGGFWKWMRTRDRGEWPKWIDSEPGPPPPMRVGPGDLRVTFVNHATVLLQLDNLNLLTDPIWSERCSPLSWYGPKRVRAPGIRFEDLPPIDAVLLSHNHYDHLDVPTLERLANEDRPRLFAGLGTKTFLDKKRIGGGVDMDWGDTADLGGGVRLTFLPVQHWSGRGLCDSAATQWGGFVIESPHGNVYFAGDTGFGPHFEEAGEGYGPFRLAVLPIGAYLPRWFMAPVHVSPTEVVEAHRLLHAAVSVPIHYGTFRLADDAHEQPLTELRAALAESGTTEEAFWILEFGEGRDVPPLADRARAHGE